MPNVSIEFVLMLGYAVFLAAVALLLEMAARHAHRRSLGVSTIGFTYHPERDVWRCPEDQHLFPVFSDHSRGLTVYRAPAATCNACKSKSACTDSDLGREVQHRTVNSLENGMRRFHRVFSLMLLLLASLILAIEFYRVSALYPRVILAGFLSAFCVTGWRLSKTLINGCGTRPLTQSSSAYFDSPRRTSKFPLP